MGLICLFKTLMNSFSTTNIYTPFGQISSGIGTDSIPLCVYLHRVVGNLISIDWNHPTLMNADPSEHMGSIQCARLVLSRYYKGLESFPDPLPHWWSPWRWSDKQTSQVWQHGLPLISQLDHADNALAGSHIGNYRKHLCKKKMLLKYLKLKYDKK